VAEMPRKCAMGEITFKIKNKRTNEKRERIRESFLKISNCREDKSELGN